MAIPVSIELMPHYDKSFGLPAYAHDGDAGFDLRAAIEKPVDLESVALYAKDNHFNDSEYYHATQKVIPCGFKIAIPEGYQLEIRSRSGLAAKHGVSVVNSPGTIDSGYRGEIMVILLNCGIQCFTINPGDRIAQAVLMPVPKLEFVQVESLEDSSRGAGGLGSTGVK